MNFWKYLTHANLIFRARLSGHLSGREAHEQLMALEEEARPRIRLSRFVPPGYWK